MSDRLARAAAPASIARQTNPSARWIETTLRNPLGHVDVLLHLHGLVAEGLLARPQLVDATAPGLTIEPGERGELETLLGRAAHRPVGPIAVVVRDPAVERSVEAIGSRFPGLAIRTFDDPGRAIAWLESGSRSLPA